jgi:hypothetical protein
MLKRNYERMGDPHSMEGWQLYLCLHERHEELISGTACQLCNAKMNHGGACIHMADPTCSAQEEQDHHETQDQILGQDSQELGSKAELLPMIIKKALNGL